MERPRLTVAAEIAAIGAFVIAIAALVLSLWSGTGTSQSPDSSNTGPTASAPPAKDSQTKPDEPDNADQPGWISSLLDGIGNTIDDIRHGTPGLILIILAAGVCVGVFCGAMLLDTFFDDGEPWSVALSLVSSTGIIAGIYTWFFWPALSTAGIAAFIASLALVWLAFVRESLF